MCQVQRGAFICAVIIACIQSGMALQCWTCSSQYDVNCKDYFNTTRLKENKLIHNSYNYQHNPNVQQIIKEPHQQLCEALYNPPAGQKYVCLKTVSKGGNNAAFPIYKRECRMVSTSFKEGYCPEDLERNADLQFCGTCSRDGCNSASDKTINALLALLLPLMTLFHMKK